MIFADASALVSIIGREADAPILGEKIKRGGSIICSPIAVWETVAALCKSYRYEPRVAWMAVDDLLQLFAIGYVIIGRRETELAYSAYEKFGRGRHKAALNMGDCFAYACAKSNNAKLLFKGGDFALTDIAAA